VKDKKKMREEVFWLNMFQSASFTIFCLFFLIAKNIFQLLFNKKNMNTLFIAIFYHKSDHELSYLWKFKTHYQRNCIFSFNIANISNTLLYHKLVALNLKKYLQIIGLKGNNDNYFGKVNKLQLNIFLIVNNCHVNFEWSLHTYNLNSVYYIIDNLGIEEIWAIANNIKHDL
jgi:hypothetical protein